MKYLAYSTCLIILSVLLENPIQAQIWLSNDNIYNEAEQFLNADDYEEALPLYLLLEKKDFKTQNVFYKIGTCYLNSRGKKEKAIPYLEYAVTDVSSNYKNTLQETKAPIKALLMLGVAYRINNEPNKAINVFETLKDSIGNSNPEMATIVDLHIKRCENAIVLNSFPGEAIKDRLSDTINNENSNFNPLLVNHGDILYYMEGLKFYDAVKQSKLVDGHWQIPKNITPDIHSDGDHILVGSSADGNMLILYLYEPLKSGELLYTEKTNDGWTELKPFNSNINTKYNETHASLSLDGKTMFFTSNRTGGFGGMDIYISVKGDDNEWGPAINLGPEINTPYNEENPFISNNDSILYFSSQGHLNIGGYDVFYSKRKNTNSWHQPINMGAPVSTADDDLFYFPMENGLHGLMSRLEENSNSSYDIYKYKYIRFPNTPRHRVRGNISESLTEEAIAIMVIDKNTGDTIQVVTPNKNGEYDLLLPDGNFEVLVADKTGTVSKSNLDLNNDPVGIIELVSEKVVQDQTQNINSEERVDTLYLKHILFEFDDISLLPGSKDYLDQIARFLLDDNDMQLNIVGFADALGNENYNLILSRKRAQSVANYLIEKNIDKKRLIVSGKGEQDPVAINSKQDGSDSPEGRRYNRRVVVIPMNLSTKIIAVEISDVPSELRIK